MAYVSATKTPSGQSAISGWIVYPDSVDCSAVQAWFDALNPAQKAAAFKTTKPSPAFGQVEQLRPCSVGTSTSNKITEVYIQNNVGYNSLSLYCEGSGAIKMNLVATGSTPAVVGGLKDMENLAPYYTSPLFTGVKHYGGLYVNLPIGTYKITFLDDEGGSLTYNFTLTGDGPKEKLKGPDNGGGDNGGNIDSSDQAGETDQQFYSGSNVN